jgi:hypothetical protein
MKQYKKADLILLPTKSVSRLYIADGVLHYSSVVSPHEDTEVGQSLYLVTDEEPQFGDWAYYPEVGVGRIVMIDNVDCFFIARMENDGTFTQPYKQIKGLKKVVATTHPSLWTATREFPANRIPIPHPDDTLIEEFVKKYNVGHPIPYVLIEYERVRNGYVVGWKEYADFIRPAVNSDGSVTTRVLKIL